MTENYSSTFTGTHPQPVVPTRVLRALGQLLFLVLAAVSSAIMRRYTQIHG